jgi:hypothetical protein
MLAEPRCTGNEARYFYFFNRPVRIYTGRFFNFTAFVGKRGRAHVEELVQWLRSQHKGLRTYKTFQQRVLEAGAKHRDQYALYFLLAILVGRFVEAYEETPLTLDITDEAHKRLVAISEKAAKFDALSAEKRLGLLNEIASSDLN